MTGDKIENDGNIGFYDTTISVIEEGDKQEFFGWILPGLNKFSASKTFFHGYPLKRNIISIQICMVRKVHM